MGQPLNLDDIRRRHASALAMYNYLTGAELDRAALLAEVDRLLAEMTVLQSKQDPSAAEGGWRRTA